MNARNTFRNLLSLTLLALLSGCAFTQVKVPDTEVCSVAGIMAAGADCDHTLKNQPRSLTLDEWIEFLEPQEAKDGKPARGPAMCQSSEDWNKQKTALEQACKKLGAGCTYEMQQMISTLTSNIGALQQKSMSKKEAAVKKRKAN